MKIGFSYSRCVRDIANGVVDIDNVLIIISRTDFDPTNDEQWTSIWLGYRNGWSNPEWIDCTDADEQRYRDISMELYTQGKLHQPRKFGAHPRRSPYVWVDTGPIGHEQYEQPESVQQAWQHYLMLAALTGSQNEKETLTY
jgi:hypothetical protein